MTDTCTITNRQTVEGDRLASTVCEFDSGTRLLSIRVRGGHLGFDAHFSAEEWGQFQAMIAEFGSPRQTVRLIPDDVERLMADFEREAQERYDRDEDGSDWQEAHRRVEALLRETANG